MVNRVVKYGLVAMFCVAPALFAASPANAIISSAKKMDNGKICRVLLFIPHHHTGFGGVRKTRSAARAAAIKRWSRFTAWEYGAEWGNYVRALDKSVTCHKVRRGWRCTARAQPCKR